MPHRPGDRATYARALTVLYFPGLGVVLWGVVRSTQGGEHAAWTLGGGIGLILLCIVLSAILLRGGGPEARAAQDAPRRKDPEPSPPPPGGAKDPLGPR